MLEVRPIALCKSAVEIGVVCNDDIGVGNKIRFGSGIDRPPLDHLVGDPCEGDHLGGYWFLGLIQRAKPPNDAR